MSCIIYIVIASLTIFIRSTAGAAIEQLKHLGYYIPMKYEIYNAPTWKRMPEESYSNAFIYRYKEDGHWRVGPNVGELSRGRLISKPRSYSPFGNVFSRFWNSTIRGFDDDPTIMVESVDTTLGKLCL